MITRGWSDLVAFALLGAAVPASAQQVPILFSVPGTANSGTGHAVSGLGDVNADGANDLVVGAPGMAGEQPVMGTARVLSGKNGVLLLALNGGQLHPAPFDASEGYPPGTEEQFGYAVSGIGDVNGDGVPDVLVGAPNLITFNPGLVGVFSGATGELLRSFQGVDEPDGFGAAVAGLDDLDGDGVGELLVGAPLGFGVGYARVFSGADGELLYHLTPSDLSEDAGFGWSVTGFGDWNDDGVGDFAVGAPTWGGGFAGKNEQPGRVYVFSGADGSVLVEFTGHGFYADFGRALAGGADVNADGHGDLIVGSPGFDWGRGRVEVYSGRRAAAASGGLGLVLASTSRDEYGFGSTVATAGDIDADGHDDVLVGVPFDREADLDGAANSHVHAISGATGDDLLIVEAPLAGWNLGSSLGYVGDLFGSGSNSFVLGASGFGGQTGQALVAFTPGPSDQEALPEPKNALAGRPGGPALLHLPLAGGSDISFGPLVVTPKADGDSVAASLFEPENTAFVSFTEESVGEKPQEASTASLNHDGREDFVTANSGDDTFSAVLSDGTTSFAGGGANLGTVFHVSTGINVNPRAIASGDLDGDGLGDVVVSGDVGISSYLGDGVGGFTLIDLQPKAVVTDVRLAQLDGDGLLDLLASSGAVGGGGNVQVYFGNGDGTFSVGGTFAQGPPKVSIRAADFDGDGDEDVLVVGHFVQQGIPRARIGVHLNDGAGAFANTPEWSLLVSKPGGLVPTYAAVADMTRDGLLDVVLTHSDNAAVPPGTFAGLEPPLELTILVNQGAGGSGGWQGFSSSTLGTAYVGRAVEPILEDMFTDPAQPLASDPDLVLVWYVDEHAGQSPVPQETSFIGLFVGDGQGSFFDPDPNQFVLGDQPGDGEQGDVGDGNALAGAPGLQGDGIPDLVFPNLVANSLKVLLGNGHGGVSGVVTIEGVDELDTESLPPGLWSGGPRAVRLTHLDDDGLLDAVVYNDWRDDFLGDVRASLSLFRATGAGGFVKTQYLVLPRAGELVVADVDGDGLSDVVVSQRIGPGTEDFLLVHRGRGDGTLEPLPTVVGVPNRRLTGGLAEGPLGGGPGRALFASSRNPVTSKGQLLTFIERPGQGLALPIISGMDTGWKSVDSLAAMDMDLDGLTDVAVGTTGGRLVLARGLGAGAFQERVVNPASAAVGGGSIALGRLDGDGFPDVISSKGNKAGQSGVHVLSGQPSGDFVANQLAGLSATGALGAQRPLLLDFDDDGTLDVVLSHGTSNAISVLLSDLNAVDEVAPGKPGSGGITPDLGAKGYTTPGSQLTLKLGDALGGAQGWLLVGSGIGGLVPAIPPEKLVLVLPLEFGGTAGEPGGGDDLELRFRLPSAPAALGLQFVVQFVVDDAGATLDPGPAGLAASSALMITLVD